MGRLKAVQSRLSAAPSLMRRNVLPAAGPSPEADRSRQRDQDAPWRKWYKTARWQKLRLRIIARDLWICQQTGVTLSGKHPAPNSPVVDHKLPHHGDASLFWDETNLQTVSKSYHDSEKQRLERGGAIG